MIDIYEETRDCWLEKFEHYVRTTPDRMAVAARDVSLTYAQLYARAQRFAEILQGEGVGEGDYVLCCASASVSFMIAYMGTLYCRAVFVPLERDVQSGKFTEIFNSLKTCRVIVGSVEHLRGSARVILMAALLKLTGSPAGRTYPCPPRKIPSHILFTTGSTGECKGVVIDNAQFCQSSYFAKVVGADASTVLYNFFPTNHYAFFAYACAVLGVGGGVVISQGLVGISDFFTSFGRYGVNFIFATPSVMNYLFSFGEEQLKPIAANLRIIALAGEKCPVALQEKMVAAFPGAEVVLWYGSTEAGSISNYSVRKYGAREGCIGVPNEGVRIEFVPVEGTDMQRLAAVTSYGMIGYFNERELTERILVGGSVYTDDYGYEKDGLYYVLGRIGSVILYGGYKINPGEVEEACLSCRGVAECVCVGEAHPIFGQVPKLIVAMERGAAFDPESIKAHLYSRLESHKVPKNIVCVDEIKKNANGKTDRKYYTEAAKNDENRDL